VVPQAARTRRRSAAMARAVLRAAPAGSAWRGAWRPFRQRLLRRAVRAAASRGGPAQDRENAGPRARGDLGGRPVESRRHLDAGRQGATAAGQPAAVRRRRADRGAKRRRHSLLEGAGRAGAVGSEEPPDPPAAAGELCHAAAGTLVIFTRSSRVNINTAICTGSTPTAACVAFAAVIAKD